MTAQETDVDGEFRQRVVQAMIEVLARLLDRSEPITEDMRLMEELDVSSTLGLEMLLQIEEQLLILVDVERLEQEQMDTVGELATFIASHSRSA